MCTTLHPFICWWSFRLFPCLDWGEECCCEDTNAYIFWIIALSRYMPWSGIAGSYGSSFTILNSTTGILSPPLALFIVMLSKAHLTSHSRMSISRWVTTPSWLPGSLRPFLYSYSVYSCHLFLISSASVRSILFLSFIVPIFVWYAPLVSPVFLKRSLVFPIPLFSSISLHCSLRKAFLYLLAVLWNSAFKWVYLFFFSFAFHVSSFHSYL